MKKIVGFTCDGASVNTGKNRGVIELMQEEVHDKVVLVHCLVHRLELAYKKAFQSSKLYDQVISLRTRLFSFYHVSPLQRQNYASTCEALQVTAAYPVRIGGTRWLSHTESGLTILWKGYKAFVEHLQQVVVGAPGSTRSNAQPKAKAIVQQLRSWDQMWFACFLHDVLTILGRLCKELQSQDCSISSCHQLLRATTNSIKKLKER